jgi:hypothetical protein
MANNDRLREALGHIRTRYRRQKSCQCDRWICTTKEGRDFLHLSYNDDSGKVGRLDKALSIARLARSDVVRANDASLVIDEVCLEHLLVSTRSTDLLRNERVHALVVGSDSDLVSAAGRRGTPEPLVDFDRGELVVPRAVVGSSQCGTGRCPGLSLGWVLLVVLEALASVVWSRKGKAAWNWYRLRSS